MKIFYAILLMAVLNACSADKTVPEHVTRDTCLVLCSPEIPAKTPFESHTLVQKDKSGFMKIEKDQINDLKKPY